MQTTALVTVTDGVKTFSGEKLMGVLKPPVQQALSWTQANALAVLQEKLQKFK